MADIHVPDDTPRTAKEIARRTLVLSSVIACAYGAQPQEYVEWLKGEGLWNDLSPQENLFLTGNPTKQTRRNMTWRSEAMVPLLWAIRKIEAMPSLAAQCDTQPLVKVVVFPPDPTSAYIKTARLRSDSEIHEEYEKVYQAHWRTRDAELHNKPIPADVIPEVVQERHYAFNWIIGYMGQSWDEISTDT